MNTPHKTKLPIDDYLEEIGQKYSDSDLLIVKSSPGSGKTTRIPPFLLERTQGSILTLVPRRLAAKFAALRMADERGEKIGQTVGYSFRFERVVSAATRLIAMTEGTFLRQALEDPTLKGVSTVILDEFHERHVQTDLALGIVRHLQKTTRPDLKIIIMSATLEVGQFQSYLGQDCKVASVDVQAPVFPLETIHLPNDPRVLKESLTSKVIGAINHVFEKSEEGDILVFLPGIREINQVQEALQKSDQDAFECLILHGDLSSEEQGRVMSRLKRRKIILSTNIAESSVTIPGVSFVIDSGLHRQMSFSPWSGLSELVTKKIAKASATQRAGRAARIGPGTCLRLYSKMDHDLMPDYDRPEILRSDLTDSLLQLLAMEKKLPHFFASFPWFEAPTATEMARALGELRALSLLDEANHVTALGEMVSKIPLSPRLAKLLLYARLAPHGRLLEGAFQLLFKLNREGQTERSRQQLQRQVDQALAASRQEVEEIRARKKDFFSPTLCLEELLLHSFPDRIAGPRKNGKHELLLASGECLKISQGMHGHFDPGHPLWVVVDVSSALEITLAEPIEMDWIYGLDHFPVEEDIQVEWNGKLRQVMMGEQQKIGKLVLEESSKKLRYDECPPRVQGKVDELIAKLWAPVFAEWSKSSAFFRLQLFAETFQQREAFQAIDWEAEAKELSRGRGDFPEDALGELNSWAAQKVENLCQGQRLVEWLPEVFSLSDRRQVPIHYESNQAPWIEGMIQDFYGLGTTPSIAKGKIKLVLRPLGPHKRPVQVTQDLESFWKNTYPELKREFQRDYPRHHWPEDPRSARPILLKRQL